MTPLLPEVILYVVLSCITSAAGVAAMSLDRFQKPLASAFAALGAVSPWLWVPLVVMPHASQSLAEALLLLGFIGSWELFAVATLAYLWKRPGPPNRRAAAASLAGVLAGGGAAFQSYRLLDIVS